MAIRSGGRIWARGGDLQWRCGGLLRRIGLWRLWRKVKWHEGRGVTDPEDRDEYAAANIFRVPKVARWDKLQASAKQPTIGNLVDDAVVAIEKENPKLKGVLPKDYARPTLDKHRLGELIDIISKIGLGDGVSRSKDILGRVYEYFPGRFAAAEGKGDCEFYMPQCVVKLLVRMIEPYKCRIFDPCCGSGSMFVQSERSLWNTAASWAIS